MNILSNHITHSDLIAVENALNETFGTWEVTEMILLKDGLSGASLYRIAVNNRPYVLKIDQYSAFRDNKVEECTQIAAKAGIAPPLYYSNKTAGVLLMEYIENEPLKDAFQTANLLITELAQTIRRIHQMPAFPAGKSLVATIDELIDYLKGSSFDECLGYYEAVRHHYPWADTDTVPSHHDLNPGNILFDGKKMWLIDWHAAFQSDRYVDLATAAIFYVAGDDQENIFLQAYFGQTVSAYQRSRFFLMRQVCGLVYGALLINNGLIGQTLLKNVLTGMRSPRLATSIAEIRLAEETKADADI